MSSNSTSHPTKPQPAPTPSLPTSSVPTKLSQFAVGTIPAFKATAPINYAAAASAKAKPSPPALNGKDAVAVTIAPSALAHAAPQPPVVASTPAAVPAGSAGAPRVSPAESASGISKTAPVVGPPGSSNGNPKISGVVPAVPVVSTAAINMHAFFTGGGSPAPSAPSMTGPPAERRSLATYDPSSSRSPQPPPSNLSGGPQHNTQLSSNSRSFAPGSGSTPSFVPQQSQQFLSQSPQYHPPSPYQHSQQQQQQHQGSPYLQHAKPPPQNIPNGSNNSYGGPGGPGPNGQRSGSFVGSPVMQHQMQQQRNQGPPSGTPNRSQFPTSPRLANPGLPGQQGMMYPGQQPQWQQPQQQYGAPYQPFYPYPQPGYGPPPGPSTPNLRAGVPPSPSMAMQQPPLSATSAQFAPTAFPGSPAQSPALTPHNIQFGSTTGPLTPGARSSTSQFSVAGSNAGDYKPAPEAQAFTPRKSAAIKIRNPKDLPTPTKPVVATPPVVDAAVKVEEKTAMPAVVPVVEKVDDSAAKKVEEDKKVAEDEKVAEEKKDAEEKRAAEEKIKVDAAAAAAAVAEEKSKVAAETKAKEESIAKEAAAAKEAVAAKEAAAAKDALAEEEAAAAKESDAAAAKEDVVTPALGENALAPVVEGVVTPTPVDSTPAPSSEKAVNGESTTVVDEAKAAADAALVAKSLAAAKPIENLNDVAYPAEIKSPRSDLNVSAEPGKYRYDREFLLQFMAVCQEKPEQLPNLESIGMLDAGSDANARPGFAGGRRAPSMGPPAVPNRAGGAPAAGFGSRNSSMGQFSGGMGNFGGGGAAAGMSSEDRFKASLAGGPRAGSAGGFPARAGGSMSRSSSQSGTIMAGANFVPSNQQGGRIRSGRGKPRDNERGGGGKPGQHVSGQGFEDAAPLEATANRWTPTVVGGAPAAGASDPDSPEMVQRKVKALLNKLTLEKFDSISGQILAWANKSENEVDGRILRQVIALIFEKATDEANWSEMYARLCRKLMEMVSTNVSDDSVKNADGTPVVGGALFRKYLLNRCQEDYESGWKLKEVAAAAAAATAADDNAKKEANDAAKESEEAAGAAGTSSSEPPKEAELLSDEYYAAQKAKRRGLGLVRFIGELYRLQMLTERIMHESIKKLLANTDTPEEEDVESLCRLLTTVGKVLDTPKAKGHLDIYCVRMNLIADNPKIASRIKFMIQDVLELRKQRWQPRHDASGPKLISEIHSDAQRATEDSARRTASSSGKGMPRLQDQLSRPGSRRGQGRDYGAPQTGPDGWSVPTPQRPAKAGDLSAFGKSREPSTISLGGPSGLYAKGAKAKEASRPTTPSNPFALLSGASDSPAEGAGPQRTRLVMAPRTVPAAGEEKEEGAEPVEAEAEEEEEEEEEDDGAIDPNAISMTRAEGERRAGNSVKEFFSVKSLAEGIASVEALPVEYRGILITAFVDAAMDLKADQVSLTRQLFAAVATKSIVSHAVFLKSLTPLVEGIIDVAVDVPSAYSFAVLLLAGAGISKEELVVLTEKMVSEEEDEETVELARVKILAAFDKVI